jgi:cytochrome c oxidase assembly factor 4
MASEASNSKIAKSVNNELRKCRADPNSTADTSVSFNNEDDEFSKRIKLSGCQREHEALQECYLRVKDWRACQQQLKDFQLCWKHWHSGAWKDLSD